MQYLITTAVCLLAGLGAGLGTGFAGMSAAAVITPMLVTFLGIEPYTAVGIALASDVLASAVSAYTYGKNKNLDIKNGLVMMITARSAKSVLIKSIICGIMVGFICGFIGAGGGMMMLLLLTSVMGYELKTAVGTSVFIMTFTALTGSVSHFAIGGLPDMLPFILCIIFTLIFARIAAKIANKASPETLNRVTGIILVILGIVVLGFSLLSNITA